MWSSSRWKSLSTHHISCIAIINLVVHKQFLAINPLFQGCFIYKWFVFHIFIYLVTWSMLWSKLSPLFHTHFPEHTNIIQSKYSKKGTNTSIYFHHHFQCCELALSYQALKQCLLLVIKLRIVGSHGSVWENLCFLAVSPVT